jgi:integrase
MANLGLKNGTYVIRFRHNGKEYKRSLKTRNQTDAAAAKNSIELTIHRILTGLLTIPLDVDPGDFIVSGGVITKPASKRERPPLLPTTQSLMDEYLDSHKNMLAESYLYSQKIHLGHFTKHLNGVAGKPCDHVTRQHVEAYLHERLDVRDASTVVRERVTLIQFYRWVCAKESLINYPSPTLNLFTIKSGKDPDPFRTLDEIKAIIERGGLTEDEILDHWDCLYLNPQEIGGLLATVRKNAADPLSPLLHSIPAYTGMRRGEVLRLTWLDVDLDKGYITARSRKQSQTQTETIRRIDLHAELIAILTDWRGKRPKGQLVLCDQKTLAPISKDLANRLFWQPMRNTEWQLKGGQNWFKIGFHSYRHSFASNLAAAGVDQRIIDEWMGHQTEAMRKRYRHLFPKNRRSAIESFSLKVPGTAEAAATVDYAI